MARAKKATTFWDHVKTVVYAVLIALVVRTIAYEPFNIPSGSMIPTLLVGDYLFVSKYSYGYSRYSLPLGLPLIPGRILFREPQRGDVAVFKLPSDNETDYIKRIIGLPGDRIQIREGRLVINDRLVPRERVEDYVEREESGRIAIKARFVETLPSGRKHMIIEETDNGMLDNTHVYTVPPGSCSSRPTAAQPGGRCGSGPARSGCRGSSARWSDPRGGRVAPPLGPRAPAAPPLLPRRSPRTRAHPFERRARRARPAGRRGDL